MNKNKMVRALALVLVIVLAAQTSWAQPVALSVSTGVRKTFTMTKKSSIFFRQQFQINPEIEKYDNEYGDLFNEDGFWPIPDRPQSDSSNNGGSGIELDDSPRYVRMTWRTNTAMQVTYNFTNWLRSNSGYGLFYNGEEFRHTFRMEMDYRPMKHSKGKRKLDLAARTMFQALASRDDGELEWSKVLIPRVDATWAFHKNHILDISNSLNGAWDDDHFEFDRWRLNLGLTFIYKKSNRFTFGYQFQQRLDKNRRSHGASFGYEIRI